MKSINIEFDQPQIEVNGIVFDLQKSDGEIYQKALDVQHKYENMDTSDESAVLEGLQESAAYIDEMLGIGALQKMSGGKPVGIVKSLEVMTAIAKAAYKSYSEKITNDYE